MRGGDAGVTGEGDLDMGLSSTSRLTRSTAQPDDVLEYVYDQLPLERRLAKLFKKKQQPPKK